MSEVGLGRQAWPTSPPSDDLLWKKLPVFSSFRYRHRRISLHWRRHERNGASRRALYPAFPLSALLPRDGFLLPYCCNYVTKQSSAIAHNIAEPHPSYTTLCIADLAMDCNNEYQILRRWPLYIRDIILAPRNRRGTLASNEWTKGDAPRSCLNGTTPTYDLHGTSRALAELMSSKDDYSKHKHLLFLSGPVCD